jgi:uncharacterized membrane protein
MRHDRHGRHGAADAGSALLGRITVVGGLLGAVSAVVIIAWPDQVSVQHFSYPFDATSYTVAQSWFAVLALGVYLFVVMFPAVFGPLLVGRMAIGLWMLMFAVLGSSLIRADREGVRP